MEIVKNQKSKLLPKPTNGLWKNPKLFFNFPVFFMVFIDGSFTILGQNQSYWNKSKPNEANPIAYIWMEASHNVLWLVLGLLIYVLILNKLFGSMKGFVGLSVRVAFYLGHFLGAILWFSLLYEKYTGAELTGTLKFYTFISFVALISVFSVLPLYRAIKLTKIKID